MYAQTGIAGKCDKWALNPTAVVNSDNDCCGDVPTGPTTVVIPNFTLLCSLPSVATAPTKPCGCVYPLAPVLDALVDLCQAALLHACHMMLLQIIDLLPSPQPRQHTSNVLATCLVTNGK